MRRGTHRSLARTLPLASLLLAAACAHAPTVVTSPPGFAIEREARDEEAARQVARVLPEALGRVERWGTFPGPVTIRIQPSSEALARAAGRPDQAWLRGWARRETVDLQSPRTWSRGRASDGAVATILAHELAHCLLFQRIGAGWARRDVPSWFEEGMASFTAGERHSRADSALLDPGPGGPVDPVLAYGTADRAFRYLLSRHGEPAVRAVLDGLAAGEPFPDAFRHATGSPVAAFEADVRAHLSGATAGR